MGEGGRDEEGVKGGDRGIDTGRDHGFEETLGDSCLLGRRTLEMSEDCVWRLHGGV